MTPAPKRGKKPKAKKKPIARRRARIKPGWWAKVRAIVFEREGGKCRYCRAALTMKTMHAAHLVGLGMGASRENKHDQRNHPRNVTALCARCHAWFDGLSSWDRNEARLMLGPRDTDEETQ